MTDPLFEVPQVSTDRLYQPAVGPSSSDITTGVGGTGAFDVIMTSLNAYLAVEFTKGRITGAEYTKTFIELTQTALATALQFTLGKDQAFWASQQAQIAAVTARVGLETAKVQYNTAAYNLGTSLPAQTTLINDQAALVTVQTAVQQFQVSSLGPVQLSLVSEQMQAQRAQTADTRSDLAPVQGAVGAQVKLYNQQIISYKRDAEVKAAKPFTDAYITAKTLDDTITPPAGFTNTNIDLVLSTLMARNNFDGTLL